MTKVAILPVPTAKGLSYHAVSGDKQSVGRTAGEALDALTSQLAEDEDSTLVIVQNLKPDLFFDAAKQQRMAELMERWRMARDSGASLPQGEQAELDSLVEAELLAATSRAASLLNQLGPK
jgi:hypothetical protein